MIPLCLCVLLAAVSPLGTPSPDLCAMSNSIADMPTATQPPASSAPAALAPDVLDEIRRLPEDPIPEQRLQSAHYYKGNEYDLEVFIPYIKDKGGAYLGIGPDQNFALSAIAKAEMVFILDYDDIVVFIDRIYVSFLKRYDTVDEIISLWGDKTMAEKAQAAIEADYGKDAEAKRYLQVHRKLGKKISEHLVLSRKLGTRGERISWLSDADSFEYTKAMARAGRIVVLKGNLLGDKAIMGAVALLKKMGMPLRVIYLSNAEEYWSRYTKGLEESFLQAEMDDLTVVIITFNDTKLTKSLPQNYYHHNIQKGSHFREWLSREGQVRYRAMMKEVKKLGKGEVSTLGF